MQNRLLRPLAVLAALLVAAPTWAAVEGTVTTNDGRPIEGARVVLTDTGEARTTDGRGRFVFADAEPPAQLRIEAPRFLEIEVEVEAPTAAGDDPPRFSLVPKSEVYAEIVVSATRESGDFEPVSVAAVSISPDDKAAPVQSVVELIEGIPSVAMDGQGGLFQAYSIRGVAGQRVKTLISGMRIETERRAGSTASFFDPLLLGDADVIRGPSSTYYGSGALGGVVQLFPRSFDGLSVSAGVIGGADDVNYLGLGWGDGEWSLGLTRRQAMDGETPDGDPLFSRFEQWGASIGRTWELASGAQLDLLVMPAVAEDIGKPNRRIPSRITSYPEETHLVTKLSYRHPSRWRLDFLAHPNTLETENLRATSRSLVENDAFDFGINAQKELTFGNGFSARVGLDVFGRRDVTATETVEDLDTGVVETSRSLDGEQDEAALYAAVRRPWGRATLEAGGRFTWIAQSNRLGASEASSDDNAWTGFLGLTLPLAGGFELAANVGTGFRFPGLSERFFSGSTGRGEVVANEDLGPERSLGTDLGLRYYGRKIYVAAYVFRTEVDDYIEEVELAGGVNTFANRASGTIEGFELEGSVEVLSGLRLSWAGQTQRGRDGSTPLASIPADRVSVGGIWERGPWTAQARLEHRLDKDDPGVGEEAIDGADLLSASVAYRFDNGLALRVFGSNLFDETYLPTADDLAVPAIGRSLGIGLSWN